MKCSLFSLPEVIAKIVIFISSRRWVFLSVFLDSRVEVQKDHLNFLFEITLPVINRGRIPSELSHGLKAVTFLLCNAVFYQWNGLGIVENDLLNFLSLGQQAFQLLFVLLIYTAVKQKKIKNYFHKSKLTCIFQGKSRNSLLKHCWYIFIIIFYVS